MSVKVGIISQARMTSTRLPGKVLITVKGMPLLQYHINRLKTSGYPVFLATTTNSTDEPIVEFAERNQIPYWRGSEANVLSRYYECAQKYSLDVVVRVTSDCPLIDGILVKSAIDEYIKDGNELVYLSNCVERTFPRGLDFEVFSFRLLEDAHRYATASEDLEHVTPYINKNKSGNVVFKHVKNSVDKSNIRITLDTEDDLTLIQKLIEGYNAEELNWQEIIALFDQDPTLIKINSHVEQKKV